MDDAAPKPKLTATICTGSTVRSREPLSVNAIQVVSGASEGIKDLSKMQYPPVGYCIYCGGTDDLRREHIVPFGLDGTAVLPKASCERCARITGAFERQVLRGPMRAVRVLRKLRSRSKHAGVPGTQHLKIDRGGVVEPVEVPLDKYPVLLHFPMFAPPRELTGVWDHAFRRSIGAIWTVPGASPASAWRRATRPRFAAISASRVRENAGQDWMGYGGG
jgi:hypothetical protein